MGKHASQDMMVPSGKLSHLVLVHPQFCFGFFKALFYGPPQPAQPNKFFQPGADRCIRDEVGILRIFPQGPSREEPNGLQGEPLVSKNNAPLRAGKSSFHVLVDALNASFKDQQPDLEWIRSAT